MSQTNVDYSANPTGTELMDDMLAKSQENILTCNSGINRPSYAVKGTLWLDTSVTPNLLKQYDGSADIILGSLDLTNHAFEVTGLSGKQAVLVSGTNIKTVNNNSLLGSGNVNIDSLPSQTGNNGKYLTTNGISPSWVTITAPTWGNIIGILSNQTDLQTALDEKAKIVVVSTLPANPDSNVWYAIPE